MKKVLLILLLAGLITSFVFAEKPTVTVLDFKANNISENDMSSIISFLSGSLFTTDKFVVIDTAQRDTILAELEFSNSGCTDESCQLEIGMLLSAEYIVIGDIALVGSRYVLSAKIIKTETSATQNIGRGVYADLDELIDDMDGFAERLSSKIGDVQEVKAAKVEKELVIEAPAIESSETDSAMNDKPVKFDIRSAVKWSALGVGSAAAGVGAYFLYDAFSFKASDVDPVYAAYKDESVTDYGELTATEYFDARWNNYTAVHDQYSGKLVLGSILGGVGLAAIGAAIYLFVVPEVESPDGRVETAFLLLPGPDSLSFSGRIRM